MGALTDRIRVVTLALVERLRHGLPPACGPMDGDVVFILDGVGGFQFAPVMIRRVVRSRGLRIGTIVCRWQWGLVGEMWTDLMWLRRNRVEAARLARRLLSHRRAYPSARLHLFGYSGGAGVAVLACEALGGRRVIDHLMLIAPALSPDYDLAPALTAVHRCTVFVSERDFMLLGLGTRWFGTIDRVRTRSAGMVGFRMPGDVSSVDRAAYERLRQVRWEPSFKDGGVSGGHIGWLSERFLGKIMTELIVDRGTWESVVETGSGFDGEDHASRS